MFIIKTLCPHKVPILSIHSIHLISFLPPIHLISFLYLPPIYLPCHHFLICLINTTTCWWMLSMLIQLLPPVLGMCDDQLTGITFLNYYSLISMQISLIIFNTTFFIWWWHDVSPIPVLGLTSVDTCPYLVGGREGH